MTSTPEALAAEPDAASFRTAMGRFPTGVAVLTQGSGDTTLALTVNSLASVSLDPLLLVIAVGADGRMRRRVDRLGSFVVNVLSERQRSLAQEFALPSRPEGPAAMRRLGAAVGVTGNAVIPTAEAYFECVLHAGHEAGDHELFVGRVVALSGASAAPDPLVFHRGRYTRLPHGKKEFS